MICISTAHSSKDGGAHNETYKISEYYISSVASVSCFAYLKSKKIPCMLYDAGYVDDFKYAKTKTDLINAVSPLLALEIHCNSAANKDVNYSEVIYHPGSMIGESAAIYVSKAVWEGLKGYCVPSIKNNGPRAEKEKSLFFLDRVNCPSIIIEGVFISHDTSANWLAHGGADLYGLFVGKGIEKWYTDNNANTK